MVEKGDTVTKPPLFIGEQMKDKKEMPDSKKMHAGASNGMGRMEKAQIHKQQMTKGIKK